VQDRETGEMRLLDPTLYDHLGIGLVTVRSTK
jgi:hypothetical protein